MASVLEREDPGGYRVRCKLSSCLERPSLGAPETTGSFPDSLTALLGPNTWLYRRRGDTIRWLRKDKGPRAAREIHVQVRVLPLPRGHTGHVLPATYLPRRWREWPSGIRHLCVLLSTNCPLSRCLGGQRFHPQLHCVNCLTTTTLAL